MLPGGINININSGHQGIHGPSFGNRSQGAGPMMRMMAMMMRMMQQMMGGSQGGQCCCHSHRPNFGTGQHFQQPGAHFQMGASISAFLG